eukprot:GHRR01018731.1.p1 GENE.GHRR01018731.1~~GHRR01018731.1.p1  ORF type:complete len:103 (+),score=37.45 GHRR01018731.1:79-387(+)
MRVLGVRLAHVSFALGRPVQFAGYFVQYVGLQQYGSNSGAEQQPIKYAATALEPRIECICSSIYIGVAAVVQVSSVSVASLKTQLHGCFASQAALPICSQVC